MTDELLRKIEELEKRVAFLENMSKPPKYSFPTPPRYDDVYFEGVSKMDEAIRRGEM